MDETSFLYLNILKNISVESDFKEIYLKTNHKRMKLAGNEYKSFNKSLYFIYLHL